MKPYILLSLFLFPLLSFAQIIEEFPTDEKGNLNFNEVVQVDSASQEELYLRAKICLLELFQNSKEAFILDEKEAGIIICKGCFEFTYMELIEARLKQLHFSIKVECKDNRYKYQVYDIYFLDKGSNTVSTDKEVFDKEKFYRNNGKPKTLNERCRKETIYNIGYLTSSLKKNMKIKTANANNNDW